MKSYLWITRTMAVVVRPEDVDAFVSECNKKKNTLLLRKWLKNQIWLALEWWNNCRLGAFLSLIQMAFSCSRCKVVGSHSEERTTSAESLETDPLSLLYLISTILAVRLQTIFWQSVGLTVNHPLGGRYQITPTEASVQKLPVQSGFTNTASVAAFVLDPYLAECLISGAAYAVIGANCLISCRW